MVNLNINTKNKYINYTKCVIIMDYVEKLNLIIHSWILLNIYFFSAALAAFSFFIFADATDFFAAAKEFLKVVVIACFAPK